MISFKEARHIVHTVETPTREKILPIMNALGHRLFRSVRAPESLPSFDNSAMDGWALRSVDLPGTLAVQGEIAAGDCKRRRLEQGKTLRIFTGAPIPEGAEAVIAQEEVQEIRGAAVFLRAARPGENIRKAGEDVRRGDMLLQKNHKIGPGQISLLAAMGITQVPVQASPRVAHMATGSELLPFDRKTKSGQIRDSVSPLLESSLRVSGLPLTSLGIVRDEETAVEEAIGRLLTFDIAIITGGVSVGKYDGVRSALAKAGVQTLFWKVDMKPGKPLYFGRRKDTFIFGLPGNPLSSLVGFEFFVKPLIARWMGDCVASQKTRYAMPLKKTVAVHGQRKTHLVTVTLDGKNAVVLTPQGSHRIGQLATAQGLAILSGNKKHYASGLSVPVHRFEITV